MSTIAWVQTALSHVVIQYNCWNNIYIMFYLKRLLIDHVSRLDWNGKSTCKKCPSCIMIYLGMEGHFFVFRGGVWSGKDVLVAIRPLLEWYDVIQSNLRKSKEIEYEPLFYSIFNKMTNHITSNCLKTSAWLMSCQHFTISDVFTVTLYSYPPSIPGA